MTDTPKDLTAPELKPCPFCGGKAELWRAHPHPGRAAWISCMGKCSVLVSKEHKTDAEAIAAWNTRADLCDPMQDARVKALVDAVKAMPDDWYSDGCDCKPCEALQAALRDVEGTGNNGD